MLRGGVELFGSDEERGEGIVFYYMWVPHDISYVEKFKPHGDIMGKLTVKRY